MSLTVKAYLERPATRCTKTLPEIRRFSVDQEVASSLEYLTTKIAQAFPELASQAYTLCWKGKLRLLKDPICPELHVNVGYSVLARCVSLKPGF